MAGRSTPGNADALVSCFTTDCTVIEEVFEDPDQWEGHDGVRRLGGALLVIPRFSRETTSRYAGPLVEGKGESCSVKSFAFVTECRGEPPYTLRFTGYYDDRLVKIDGEWLFRERDDPSLGWSRAGAFFRGTEPGSRASVHPSC